MTLAIIHDLRRDLGQLTALANASYLTPQRFRALTDSLAANIDTVEAYLDDAAVIARVTSLNRRRGRPMLAWSASDPPDPDPAA